VDFLFRHARNHDHGVIQDKVRRAFNGTGGCRRGTPRFQVQPADGFRFFVLGPVAVVKGVVTVHQAVVLPPFLGEFRDFPGDGVDGEQAAAGLAFFIRGVFAEVDDFSFRVPGQAVRFVDGLLGDQLPVGTGVRVHVENLVGICGGDHEPAVDERQVVEEFHAGGGQVHIPLNGAGFGVYLVDHVHIRAVQEAVLVQEPLGSVQGVHVRDLFRFRGAVRDNAQVAVLVLFRGRQFGADAGEVDVALRVRSHAFRVAVNGNGGFFQRRQRFGRLQLFFGWRSCQRAARQAEKE